MGIQEIIVGIIVVLAVVYLIRYFYLQTKSHNCDDCGLMKMKKEGDIKKSKS
ncbi:MAG: FeoB-associated Cys-rich membrane protein [Bacteroidetes bacterium]|nr:MAG: FeoB-associated Cys-rich membrane protein [Bacteroidota bacterium]MBL1144947.1 FeoB-associated Cys-rich membrane protein [Bacteroidota bacterium]MCB0803636.1 FeoB-associated Cys-rich membrane protein [Flavobacteriales bacterium]NOG57741.1 FeoB-associated Cys-rich membrane protein [Bacteroidota bacterium]